MMTKRPSLHSLLDLSCTIKIVDVGANPIDGPAPYAALLAGGHADVVGFEPNLDALAKLNDQKGPRETYMPYAVGDGRRQTLRHCFAPGMTSLLQPNPDVLALFHGFSEWGRVVRTEEVDTARLDDIPETRSVDLLKIDIQGAELMVFENAVERLRGALVVQTEVEFLPMYVDQPLFSDIERFLRQYGFLFHRFAPLVSRTIKPMLFNGDPYAGLSQLFWADAIFVKNFVDFGEFDSDQLVRSAVILHDCYGSFDLVARLLIEYDRRTGARLSSRYIQAASGKK